MYAKQEKYDVSLFRKSQEGYYMKLNVHDICDTTVRWKAVDLLPSEKMFVQNKINLKEENIVIEKIQRLQKSQITFSQIL